jgi:hypothetical protein
MTKFQRFVGTLKMYSEETMLPKGYWIFENVKGCKVKSNPRMAFRNDSGTTDSFFGKRSG